ncbi:unnamed protein product [Enterobius vermicularis]|uniref:CTL-like protein 2 n=1 Tax=Enterobius vermicularis TaxID=51028 RepID=A0A0N4UYD0_ENTVE|nr:unnamed protein product [Enterobius vermicularis]
MTNKKDRTRKVHPSAPIYSESSSPYPSTSFSQFPPSQFVGSSVQKQYPSSDTYTTTNCAPPLPEREQIVIGRHAARFNIKKNHLQSTRCKSPTTHKRFINPIVSGKRNCTDISCCFLFVIFIVGWAFVAYLGKRFKNNFSIEIRNAFENRDVFAGFQWGKPERLLHPTDSAGRMCGVEKKGFYDLRSKPYLFYFDITRCASYSTVLGGCQTPQICIERCPSVTYSYLQLQTKTGQEFKKLLSTNVVCDESVNKSNINNFSTLKKFVDNSTCAKYIVASAEVLGRCLPGFLSDTFEKVAEISRSFNETGTVGLFDKVKSLKNNIIWSNEHVVATLARQSSFIEKIAADISVTWWHIMIMLLITAVISFLWTIIMRLFGPLLIWATIFFVVTSLTAGSGYCWWRFKNLKDEGAINDYSFYPNFDVYFEMPTTWMIVAIILTIFAAIIILVLLCIRNRITLAIALIQESSKAVGAIVSSLFLPVLLFIIHIAIFSAWAVVSVWIASSGSENCRIPDSKGNLNNGTECDCSTIGINNSTTKILNSKESMCQYVNLTRNENQILVMQLYNLIGFFWSSWFASAICDITLAGAFASYYWAFNKSKDVPPFPILLAFRRAIRYHLGTVAFGSLIITTVKIFRIMLDFIDRKLNSMENKVAKAILKCFKCLFWCVEVFLKFLTKNAYIMTAIYGTNFFTAAKDSFSLIWNNAVRYAVLVKITDFLLFLGKITITIGMGVVAFHWFAGRWVIQGLPHIDLYYYFVPILLVVIGAYIIADLFFEVYEMAVRTTFLCFLEDAQNNDGTPDKPYYMSKELRKIMGKENQFKCITR